MPDYMSDFSTLPEFPYPASPEIFAAASKVKLALFDVDGVLTDGSLCYGPDGEQTKTFNALDGHGLKMLESVGVTVGIISARNSVALKTRLSDLGIKHSHLGVKNKLQIFQSLIEELELEPSQCAFTGDDVIDLPVMLRCGLKFSVSNGHFIVRHAADWIAPIAGGSGAVRAICDLLLYSQNKYPLGSSTQQ